MTAPMALTLMIAVVFAGSALGQGIPSPQDCRNRVDRIGENNLLQQLSSCQGSTPSTECCNKAKALLGFPGSGQLAGCLCNAENLDLTLSTIENNALARLAGVNRAGVQSTLNQCKVANIKLAGSCPGAGGASKDTTGADNTPEDDGKTDDGKTNGKTDDGNDTDGNESDADSDKGSVDTRKATGYKHPFLHKHLGGGLANRPILSALLGGGGGVGGTKGHHGHWLASGRRLLAVEVTAPGTNVAVGKAGVDVQAPGTTVQVKKPVAEVASKAAAKAKTVGDAKADAATDRVVEVKSREAGGGKDKAVKGHHFHHHNKGRAVVKRAVAVHTAIHKAFTEAVTAKLAAVANIHKAKANAVHRHKAAYDVSKSG